MCGRYTITQTPQQLQDVFDFVDRPDFPPRYNIAPGQPVPIVRLEGGKRRLVLVRWGLVPGWSKQMPSSMLINARGESVRDKPSFRDAFRYRRCLLPADGFYEWQAAGKGPKQPYHVRLKSGRPFAMAGIWEHWQTAEGSELETCAIVTTEANEVLKPIHHRMPVILAPEDFEAWLDVDGTPPEEAAKLLKPAPSDWFEIVPVSTRVNRAANDGPGLIEPVTPDVSTASTDADPEDGQLPLI